ncbi:protein SCAI [Hibiscus syriacus]|uniref:protein SCAI n=1 Tax=Hibiscus syriacus TaxID=106335 RepID=UPI001921D266|nr:protein SCAI [Hibiscus syriacus]
MSQQQMNNNNSGSGNIPVSERYWTLVDKADKKFSKIRDLPYYERNRYDTYFYKVFKVYTQLWKFQQENRQKIVEAGLKRWEIGEIASRIAQLYYGQYMQTSEASYLSEAYIFYEAILTREYFKEGSIQDFNLANKQLRFLARFLMVCLVLNRREMVHQLVNQLKMLVDECRRTFQDTDFKEWKLVVQEIVRFLKADTAFMNIRPLRYSLVLDPHPDVLPQVAAPVARKNLRLRDAVLSSYHRNEVKFSELTLDTFRMLQCLEWEPSGSFYLSTGGKSGQNGALGSSRINHSQDITDPTLPPNPRKAVLYRPSLTHFIAVLATICEELPPDGVLLVYLSASGTTGHTSSPSGSGPYTNTTENITRDFQSHTIHSDGTSTSSMSSPSDSPNPSASENKGDFISSHTGCLQFGNRGSGGLNCIYPSDLIPFTRRPLFIIIESDVSEVFKAISGAEKGERAALFLSPSCSFPISTSDSSRHSVGSLFTIFLTAPLQAFCLLLGISGSDVEMDTYEHAESLLSSSLNDWGLTLATSDNLDPVWAQILRDPFLRRFLLRFVFCRAVLTLFVQTYNKKEFHPECMPALPNSVSSMTNASQTAVLQLAKTFHATKRFVFTEAISLPDHINSGMES